MGISIFMFSDDTLTPGEDAERMLEKASLPRRLVDAEPRCPVCACALSLRATSVAAFSLLRSSTTTFSNFLQRSSLAANSCVLLSSSAFRRTFSSFVALAETCRATLRLISPFSYASMRASSEATYSVLRSRNARCASRLPAVLLCGAYYQHDVQKASSKSLTPSRSLTVVEEVTMVEVTFVLAGCFVGFRPGLALWGTTHSLVGLANSTPADDEFSLLIVPEYECCRLPP